MTKLPGGIKIRSASSIIRGSAVFVAINVDVENAVGEDEGVIVIVVVGVSVWNSVIVNAGETVTVDVSVGTGEGFNVADTKEVADGAIVISSAISFCAVRVIKKGSSTENFSPIETNRVIK